MRRHFATAASLILIVLSVAALNMRTTRGAAQATNTPEPIVIEFATSTPTVEGKDDTALPTSTPRVFLIATLPPTEEVAQTAPTATAEPEESDEDTVVSFEASDWIGGFYQSDPDLQAYYGRPWVAVYGAESDYPQATLAFELDGEPNQPIQVTILGLDDELEALNRMAVEINDRRVYEDEAIFGNWNAVSGDPSVWTEVRLTIDPSLLRDGVNTLTFLNLEPVASFNGPPYFLLGAGTIDAADVEVALASPDQVAVAIRDGDDDNRGNSEGNRQDDKKNKEKDKDNRGRGNADDDADEEDDD
jgi:hypothetical protein